MDLAARYEGCPLSEVIGGRKRDRIKLYGSAGMYMSPEGYAREAEIIAKMGFSAYKMRPALGPEQDLKTVELMRQAVGPKVGLMMTRIPGGAWAIKVTPRKRSPNSPAKSQIQTHLARGTDSPDDHDAYRKLRAQKILRLPLVNTSRRKKVFTT